MNAIRFKSILAPDNIGYEWTNDATTFWDTAYKDPGALHCAAGCYETLGDGDTQHSPLRVVFKDKFTDFCLSLALFLVKNPGCGIKGYQLGFDHPNDKTIDFLANLVHREDKQQYYCAQELKTSCSSSKQHDKRWERVPSWADGTIDSAIGLYHAMHGRRHLEFIKWYHALERFECRLSPTHAKGPNWEKNCKRREELTGDHRAAYYALKAAVEAIGLLEQVQRFADCCLHNSRRAEAAA